MAADPSAIAATLREQLSAEPGKCVYGVVDAARCVDLAFEAKIHFGAQIRSLFQPEMQARLWNVSPYLVPIDPASGYLENWARRWGENAGVLLVTDADENTLHEHLRKIFVVQDEQAQEFFFRFYDPRVLLTFLPTCSIAQLAEFFGGIREFVVEARGGSSLVRLSRRGSNLVQTPIVLDATSDPPHAT